MPPGPSEGPSPAASGLKKRLAELKSHSFAQRDGHPLPALGVKQARIADLPVPGVTERDPRG